MKRMTGFLAAGFFVFLIFSSVGEASLGQVTLAWTRNTEPDLAGYKLHYGTVSGSYTNQVDVGNVDHYTLQLPAGATYYIVATAYNTSNEQSTYSNEVSHQMVVTITAEDGDNVSDWVRAGGTGSATSVFDANVVLGGSNVVAFSSSSPTALTVFRKDLAGLDVSLVNASFSFRYVLNLGSFFLVDTSTTYGNRKFLYRPQGTSPMGSSTNITFGFGSSLKSDGAWHSITRYLQDDLTLAQPGNNLLSINYFAVYVYGSGDSLRIDELEFFSD